MSFVHVMISLVIGAGFGISCLKQRSSGVAMAAAAVVIAYLIFLYFSDGISVYHKIIREIICLFIITITVFLVGYFSGLSGGGSGK